MPNSYTIKEFESFTREKDLYAKGFHRLPASTFDALENFILENKVDNEEQSAAYEFLSLSVKHGLKVISAKNYVGLITMKDGTTIEILPKLDNADDTETKEIFRKMLSTVKDLPYKSFHEASVMSDKMNLFEIFIKMFLDEVGRLIKSGLKSGYVEKEDNERFLKGRLNINKHIKNNYVHKERFYVEYDEFNSNRPENKLIKSTLAYLVRQTHKSSNKRLCHQYLAAFADVDESNDYAKDFSKYIANRNMLEYDQILKWCRIFLFNKSFTVFKGSEVAFALLFPMEQLFESYVADVLKKALELPYHLSAQDRKYHLFDNPKKFAIRPDIVISNTNTKTNIILDTKWKMLSPAYLNYGIAQGDMYQMYIYHKKYQAKKVVLIYPYNQSIKDNNLLLSYVATEQEPVTIEAIFFDLRFPEDSVNRIISNIKG